MSPPKTRVSTFVIMFAAILALFWTRPSFSTESAKPAGVIVRLTGGWHAVDSAGHTSALKLYDVVPLGALLEADADNSEIDIQLVDRTKLTRRGNGKRNVPVGLNDKELPWWRLALTALHENPPQFVSLVARGENSLPDCIAKKSDTTLDLTPAFKQMQHDSYFVSLKSLSGPAAQTTSSARIRVTWDEAKPLEVEVPGLQAGIYQLTVLSRHISQQQCWVLVADCKQFDAVNEKWNEALNSTKDWKDDGDACSRESFLKAVMFALDHSTD